jgi:OOP family OmpA-OmpF porin
MPRASDQVLRLSRSMFALDIYDRRRYIIVMRPNRFVAQTAIVATLLCSPRIVHAQATEGNVALNQFDPAPAGDRFFGVPSPYTKGHLEPRIIALFDYAHHPLVVANGSSSGAIVSSQGFLHVGLSFSLWNRLLLSMHMPIALVQAGDTPTIGGVQFPSPSGEQAGDLRIGGRVRLTGGENQPLQIGVAASMYLPTAPDNSYTGEAFRFAPEVIAGGHIWRLVWSANIRAMLRGSGNPISLDYGAGLAYLTENEILQLGVEYIGSTPLQQGNVTVAGGKTLARGGISNAELLLNARVRIVSGLWAGLAAGPGFTDAIGTPAFRATAMIGWFGQPKEDRDRRRRRNRDNRDDNNPRRGR